MNLSNPRLWCWSRLLWRYRKVLRFHILYTVQVRAVDETVHMDWAVVVVGRKTSLSVLMLSSFPLTLVTPVYLLP